MESDRALADTPYAQLWLEELGPVVREHGNHRPRERHPDVTATPWDRWRDTGTGRFVPHPSGLPRPA